MQIEIRGIFRKLKVTLHSAYGLRSALEDQPAVLQTISSWVSEAYIHVHIVAQSLMINSF